MSDSEKITINVGPVDLGRVDVLVDQGLYANRTDLIRTAIRNLLDRHEPVIANVARKWAFTVGAQHVSRKELEELREEGKKLVVRALGSLTIAKDVDPDLARDVIDSISVFGSFRAPAEVRRAIEDRLRSGPS